jgi:phytoene dehydrogenase-like protein
MGAKAPPGKGGLNMAKRVVVVGAGMSGLAAGCYARMNGYDVEVHEAHSLPGGLCTAWKRRGYLIDGCISWLLGSGPVHPYHRVYQELGLLQGREIFDFDMFITVQGADGRALHVYTDTDRFQAHLQELSPADAGAAKKLCDLSRQIGMFSMDIDKAPELMTGLDRLRLLSRPVQLKRVMQANAWTMEDLGKWFADPFLRSAVTNMFGDPQMPALALIMTLGPMNARAAGFPLGGSLELARAAERRLTDLGGRLHYSSRVEKVLERGGRAVGVRLAGGEEVAADYIISACDLRQSLFSLLDGSHLDPAHRELLDSGKVYSPVVLVNFGVDLDFSSDISCMGTVYELDEPLRLAGRDSRYFGFKNYCYEPSAAPRGKSVVTAVLPTDWEHWEVLARDPAAYEQEKEDIARVCLEQIDKRAPGFAGKVDMTDVATPLTMVRYTGNWHGAFMSWKLTEEFRRRHPYVPKTVPGLSGFYIASMWTSPPGGIPGTTTAGRHVVQQICHEDGKKFAASLP